MVRGDASVVQVAVLKDRVSHLKSTCRWLCVELEGGSAKFEAVKDEASSVILCKPKRVQSGDVDNTSQFLR